MTAFEDGVYVIELDVPMYDKGHGHHQWRLSRKPGGIGIG